MATKKGGAKKGGAKKGGAKKGGAKKGGAKKGGRKAGSLGSVLSGIGSIANTVGGIAGTVGTVTGRNKELRVGVPRGGGINDISAAVKAKFREAGCPMCRSGIDRIVLEDIVAGGGR
jgi:hypothetical protein